MKKRSSRRSAIESETPVDTFSLRTIDSEGNPPECRIANANHLYSLAIRLVDDCRGRELKRIRIYKAIKRFPPTGYSKIAGKKIPWQSDVNWGQLAFIVNNQRSSYIDVITERQECCEIKTTYGDEKEREVYSDGISSAFDIAVREWPGYLILKEQNLDEMLSFGMGIGMWDQNVGWIPDHVPCSDLLLPNETKLDLSNLEECVRRRRYTPYQLYKIIRNREAAEAMGWNCDAVIDAIRYNSKNTYNNIRNREEFYRLMSSGEFNWGLMINQEIPVFEGYWREFDGKISKGVILQEYTNICAAAREQARASADKYPDSEIIANHGFLCRRVGLFEGWEDIFFFDLDSASDVLLSEIKSLAEECFVGARQYDFTMNSLIDAVRLNMMLMIKGQNPDATKILKKMEWLPISVLPDGAEFLQNRFQLPTGEALQVMQAYMGDLFRGLGQYRVNAPTNKGGQRTKGEAELDAAETAKLTGTQLKRYAASETNFFTKLYKRFVNSKSSDEGYKYVKKFWEILEEKKIPKEAAEFKNIRSIRSNYINGAGSPSMKLIVAEKLVAMTGITPANEGQENAIVDAIAALAGRDNVARYRSLPKNKITELARVIGNENSGMTDSLINPQNFPVLPEDKHIEHCVGHQSDMQFNLQYAQGLIAQKTATPEMLLETIQGLTFKGAHVMAHIAYIQKDPTKKEWIQQFMQGMEQIMKGQDELTAIHKEMAAADSPEKQTKEDIEIRTLAAKSAIEVDTAQKMADISIGKAATSHAQRTEQRKEQAETQAAVQSAKTKIELEGIKAKQKATKQNEKQSGDKQSKVKSTSGDNPQE